MNKIDQILSRESIEGATHIKKLFSQWTNTEVVQFYKELKELVNSDNIISKLEEKAMNCSMSNKESRARKGAYIDAIVMIRNKTVS